MPEGFREVNGVKLWVDIQGEGNSQTIIALHGAPGLSTHAEPKAAFGDLADQWQVVTYDARGSGVSDAVPPYTHEQDRKRTRLNSSNVAISYAVFCLKK